MSIEAIDRQPATELAVLDKAQQYKVVDAVADLIMRTGCRTVSFENVAKAAGLSEASVKSHFKTWEGMFAATLKHSIQQYNNVWQSLVDKAKPDPLDIMLALVSVDFHPAVCNQKTMSLWHASWVDSGTQALYRDEFSEADMMRFEVMVGACKELLDEHPNGHWTARLAATTLESIIAGLWQVFQISGGAMSREHGRQVTLHLASTIFPAHDERIVAHAGNSWEQVNQ